MTPPPPPPPPPPDPSDPDTIDKARLASFSDNVISIAITLLVLDVRLPADLDHLTLGQAAHLLAPRLLGFTLSFAIVGVFWVGHHLMLKGMASAPRSLLWANNLFLLLVTLVPASAALLGGHPADRASAVIYGVNLVGVCASLNLLWWVAVRHHRRHGLPLSKRQVWMAFNRSTLGALIAAAGVGLAWVSPWVSYGVYCLTPVGYILLQLMPFDANVPSPQALASSGGGGRPMTDP